jgi:hypothetical protein
MSNAPPSPSQVGKTHARHVGADGINLFTRMQAARFLGIRKQSVLAAEQRGALAAVVIHGVHVYPRSELERYRGGRQRGALAARAFTMLEAGMSPARLVVELELEPDLALELTQRYAELAELVMCAAPKGSRAAWSRAFGVELAPATILRVLELAARTPAVRARLAE